MELYDLNKVRSDKDGRNAHESTDEDSNSDPSKPKKKAARVLERYAEKCTMHGPSHIHGAATWYSRGAWILIFLLSLGAMLYYIISLAQLYFEWPVKQTLTMSFASLQFPAVTICNVNPVRASMLKELSVDLQMFLSSVEPSTIGAIIDDLPDGNSSSNNVNIQLGDVDMGYHNSDYSNAREVANDSAYETMEGYAESWEREAPSSSVSRLEQVFRQLYATESRSNRVKAGHQLKDMLLSCSFAGKSCYPDNFTVTNNPAMGNCFTLQYSKYISKTSGPNGGLELLFFLDTEESMRGIVQDDGLQVSIQPHGMVPFPLEQGVAVDAGSHTMMHLNLVKIARKGSPYDECADNVEYLSKYHVNYSLQVCHKFCQQAEIHRSCQCIDETEDEINRLLDVGSVYRPCRSTADVTCLLNVQWRYQRGEIDCACHNPCMEYRYEKITSSRSWPHEDYAQNVLVKMACKRVSADRCQQLKAKGPGKIKREFVKLSIYFQDLNSQSVIEEADYGIEKFVADVGGNLALWLGLSLVSLLELIQLGVEICRHICCRWKAKFPRH